MTRYIVTVDPGCTVEVVTRPATDSPERRPSGFTMAFDPQVGKYKLVSNNPDTDAAWLRMSGWVKAPSRTDPFGDYWEPSGRP